MMLQLKQVMLVSAWVILFAHSVVPHAHEAKAEWQICANDHQHQEDLLDILGHIFHFSTGVDHLEEFNSGNAPVVLFFAEANAIAEPVSVAIAAGYPSPRTFISIAHGRYRPLRAPPVYS